MSRTVTARSAPGQKAASAARSSSSRGVPPPESTRARTRKGRAVPKF
jgi:hypothetical protein